MHKKKNEIRIEKSSVIRYFLDEHIYLYKTKIYNLKIRIEKSSVIRYFLDEHIYLYKTKIYNLKNYSIPLYTPQFAQANEKYPMKV